MQTPHPQSVYTYVCMHLLVCNRDKDREREKGGEKREAESRQQERGQRNGVQFQTNVYRHKRSVS